MSTTLVRVSDPMNAGAKIVTMPGGFQIIAVDALGFLGIVRDGLVLPAEQRKIEILNPGGTLADADYGKYIHLGGIGGRQVFERALD